MKLAALPMYDFAELRSATDALWAAIAARLADRGVAAPPLLRRGLPLDALWADRNLLLAQTCGYPLVTSLRGRVVLVATPCYGAQGCEGPLYCSAIVVRADEPAETLAGLRGRRCAVNDAASNSGMNALRHALVPFADRGGRYFREVVWTGGHAASLHAVGEERADVAAVDCVTWAHMRHLRPQDHAGLRVLAWTKATPGLPMITAHATDASIVAALRLALDDVARDPALAAIRDTLLLDGFAVLDPATYDAVLDMERRAAAAGVEL